MVQTNHSQNGWTNLEGAQPYLELDIFGFHEIEFFGDKTTRCSLVRLSFFNTQMAYPNEYLLQNQTRITSFSMFRLSDTYWISSLVGLGFYK